MYGNVVNCYDFFGIIVIDVMPAKNLACMLQQANIVFHMDAPFGFTPPNLPQVLETERRAGDPSRLRSRSTPACTCAGR